MWAHPSVIQGPSKCIRGDLIEQMGEQTGKAGEQMGKKEIEKDENDSQIYVQTFCMSKFLHPFCMIDNSHIFEQQLHLINAE